MSSLKTRGLVTIPLIFGLLIWVISWPGLSLTAAQDQDEVILFDVLLPADAVLELQGVKMDAAGAVRHFQTPPLQTVGEYTYTLKATSQGKEVSRNIRLKHGMINSIDLRSEFPAPTRGSVAVKPVTLQANGNEASSADITAIRKSAADFAEAFNKGDARAIASMWTENGESRETNGVTIRGRAAIEKAYEEVFKRKSGAKLEVLVKSIRFPSKDLAVEEGLIRQSNGVKTMPTTTSYIAVHSRDNGVWRIALSSEAGEGVDRLEDLDWLLGTWATKVKDNEVKFNFSKDDKKSVIIGTFTRSSTGKEPVTGTIRIAADPETGKIRSWGFEDDGAHSQALWTNDGKSWLLDWRGVLADGTPANEVIVMQRAGANAITWRSIDRVIGDQSLPDTTPMRLNRTK